ncbi:MAG: ATP-binding cassette domain-containing protein [Ethanoligenens sp.]|uniref:ABC transporter ATP-binding protein n=1 Tax=Ethanoligenens sp. TaxID=2099655 RepID=UPI0039EBF3AE
MALDISHVCKQFGRKTAVQDLSFAMEDSGVFGLLGTNGAGKTTTIRMLLGILKQDTGTITWDGHPVTRENVSFGYLPEERGLYPKIGVGEQLVYFASLRGMDTQKAKQAIGRWYTRLDIGKYDRMTADQLSKGNQQKVQLAAALLHDPALVVLDEPLSGLDPVNTDLFVDVMHELAAAGKYIVLSSHQMEAVEAFCTNILMLKDGQTVLQGNLRTIKDSYGRTNLSIESPVDLRLKAELAGLTVLSQDARGLECKIPEEAAAYRFLRGLLDEGVRIDKFEVRTPSLHEIFVEKAGVSA